MSPEQVGSGKPLDRRTDIFSLGAILYVTLSGRHPLGPSDGTPMGLLTGLLETASSISAPPPPPSTPPCPAS